MKKVPVRKLVFGILGVVLGLIIGFMAPPAELTVESMHYLGLLVWFICWMIGGVMPDFMTGITFLVLAVLLKLCDFTTAFSPFAGTTTWLLVGAFGVGAMLNKTGVLRRIAYVIMQLFPGTYTGQMLALYAAGIIVSPMMPSITAKAALMSPLSIPAAEAFGFEKNSKGATGLFMASYWSSGITLSHKENSFSINYETLDMKFPNKIEYAYRLKGFDNWNYVKNNRMAVYTNIPKGNYCFQVKSTNSDGVWSNKIKEISITILPSFWESIYGTILYFIIFILIVAISTYILFVIYKLRNRVAIEKHILDIKTKFFTDMIHELRTPFTLIVAPIDHMLSQKDLNPVIQQDLALVKRNTKHTLKIINQVLDLQKLQNESKLTVQRIEIAAFIEHIINNFQSIAIQRESEITFESKESPLFLWADPDKLESILFNLITNAFKYSPKGTVIHLSVQETDTNIILQISDQGYGISQEKQKSIFNRFENYVSSDIFKKQSTGIGLSLVKELVELHKGKITLQSKINEGSIFTIYFRKGKEHFAPETEFILSDYDERPQLSQNDTLFLRDDYEAEEEACKDCGKSSILVVDDNQELLFFLHTILSEEFRVITASNGKEGLEKAIKYLPNMIVSDVVMPEMTGIEMVKKLQANTYTCHIPIVLLSSKADVENQNEGLELGVDDYITKPFSASYLIAKIWNIIRQRKRIQALYYSELIQNKEESNIDSEEQEELRSLPQADKDLLDGIVCFINKHLDHPDLSVDTLVEEAGISRSALFKKIKTLIGISPMELIKNIRLKKAAELIEEGSDNFTQVAYKVGFKDSQHFSKCFKQIYGVTPTEYRKKHLG